MLDWRSEIQTENWIKQFTGHWSLLSCHYYSFSYTKQNEEFLGTRLKRFICIVEKGHATAFVEKKEVDEFGRTLAQRIIQNESVATSWCKQVKTGTDRVKALMQKYRGKALSSAQYNEFLAKMHSVIPFIAAIKRVVDYLPPKPLKKLLPGLTEARLYSESLYTETEAFMEQWAQQVFKKTGCHPTLFLCQSTQELEKFFKSGALPSKAGLEKRFEHSAVLFKNGDSILLTGKDAKKLEHDLHHRKEGEKNRTGILEKTGKWVKLWAGKGSLQFDSNLGDWYTKKKHFDGKAAFTKAIFFYNSGITDCWVRKSDKDDFGKRLSALAREKSLYIADISKALKTCATKISEFIAAHKNKEITPSDFDRFWILVRDYYLQHIRVKYIADYLSAKERQKFFPLLEEARRFSEQTYSSIEAQMETIAEKIAADSQPYTREMILSMTKEELQAHFKNNQLPAPEELKSRYLKAAIIFDEKGFQIFTGEKSKQLDSEFLELQTRSDAITGQTAFPGTAQGIVRIVLNANEKTEFKPGNILVTGMTRPEFIPLMKLAGAVVTDAGGLLSHAAIVSRELKIPTIIGTENATKKLKTGDFVEVDATNGKIRILQKKGKK